MKKQEKKTLEFREQLIAKRQAWVNPEFMGGKLPTTKIP
jgi:hypothetical protein